MDQSILNSVKKVLGIAPEYKAFDEDISLYINGTLSTLTQLGVGPEQGFQIEDESTLWSTFLGDDPRFNSVKNYVCLKVKLLFDPPATSFAINMIEQQIEELGWRISVERETRDWRAPVARPRVVQIIDGGSP